MLSSNPVLAVLPLRRRKIDILTFLFIELINVKIVFK